MIRTNVRLNNELSQAREKIRTLQTQRTLVRHETITFVLEQLVLGRSTIETERRGLTPCLLLEWS